MGLFSLGLGLVLFALIVIRCQQAANDGNPELRNDSYWVMVSPAVFSIFGVILLRAPRRPRDHGSGTGSVAGAPSVARARQGVERATLRSHAAQEAVAGLHQELERQLTRARAEATTARTAALASQQELDRATAQAAQTLADLKAQLERSEQGRTAAEASLRQVLDQQPADRTDALLTASSAELQEARTLLNTLLDGAPGALEPLRRQAEQALQAAQQACGEVTALAEQRATQLARAQELIDRCTALEQGELAALRRDTNEALAAAGGASSRLVTVAQDIQQAQQARMAVEQDIAQALRAADQAREQTSGRAEANLRHLEELESSVADQLQRLRQDTAGALEASQEARQLVDRLEQVVFSQASPLPPSPEASAYQEACGELGVLPGSTWQQVRASWRRNLMRWHPDQGGDPELWPRRQTAYQLLEAWYAFNASP